MNNILQFDLYIFDLDGVIINSEYEHFMAYKNSLKQLNYEIDFDTNIYNEKQHVSNNLIEYFNNLSYEKIYNLKKQYLINNINNIELIPGFNIFYNLLKSNNKNIAIYTATNTDFLYLILNKFDFLKDTYIVSNSDIKYKKPHPDGYFRCIKYFNSKNPIIIEDSPKNILSLCKYNISTIYFNTNNIDFNHKLLFTNYNEMMLYNNFTINNNNIYNNYLDKYINNILNMGSNLDYNINMLKNLILSSNIHNNIYITGIGKNAYVSNKIVSSWNSLGIKCYYINPIDCFHGTFGVIRDNDYIIIISNSGNTEELINFTNYIKNRCYIISVTNNNNSLLNSIADYSLVINKNIYEVDYMNCLPTSSIVNFIIFFDIVGIEISKQNNYTKNDFIMNHPGGDLGKYSNNIIDYIVIVACGESSRLHPYTLYIPKLLIEFKGNVFLYSLLDYWKKYCKNIIIIINNKFYNILQMYSNIYNKEYDDTVNIDIKCYDKLTGTADTIYNVIDNKYYNKNIIFSWSDIIPNTEIDITQLNLTTFFTSGNNCRYGIINNKVSKLDIKNGNIIGIYYIYNYKKNNYNIGDDICDIYLNNVVNTYNLDNVIDIGSIEDYHNNNSSIITRYFNTIHKEHNNIIKTIKNNALFENELNWYKSYISNNIPKLISYTNNSITLEYINGIPLYQYNINIKDIDNIKIILDTLHNNTIIVDNKQIIDDIFYEMNTKVNLRLNEINPLLEMFNNITSVNNVPIKKISIEKISNIISNFYKNSNIYHLIHGDTQFSNILKTNSHDLFLIDPRGYFGKTKLYGIKEYDYAKVLYALSGYDIFNNNTFFYFTIVNNNLDININNLLDLVNNIEWLNTKLNKYIVVIIWLSLTSYIKNNPLKVISSYYYAHYLFMLWKLDDYTLY